MNPQFFQFSPHPENIVRADRPHYDVIMRLFKTGQPNPVVFLILIVPYCNHVIFCLIHCTNTGEQCFRVSINDLFVIKFDRHCVTSSPQRQHPRLLRPLTFLPFLCYTLSRLFGRCVFALGGGHIFFCILSPFLIFLLFFHFLQLPPSLSSGHDRPNPGQF